MYTLCLAIYIWIALFQLFAMVKNKEGAIPVVVLMLSLVLLSAPFFMEFFSILAFNNGGIVHGGTNLLPLWPMAVGGALAIGLFGTRLFRIYGNQNTKFTSMGANVFAFLIGVYMIIVVGDQMRFYSMAGDDFGVMNWSEEFNSSSSSDVRCNSPILIVKDTQTEETTYRCPSGEAFVIGRFSSTPIVPWPSYTEGTSKQLSVAIQRMMNNAQKVE